MPHHEEIVGRIVKRTRRIPGGAGTNRDGKAPRAGGGSVELPALKPLRVLVAGEVILDRYLWGDVARISPEAPIPISASASARGEAGQRGLRDGEFARARRAT